MVRTRQTLIILASLAISIFTASTAGAQIAVGGTVGVSTQAAGEDERPYLGPGFGGSNIGGVIFFDINLDRVSLGAEFSSAGNISGSQQQRAAGGINTLLSTHHDRVVSGTFKFTTVTRNRFRLAAVGGMGFARRHTERTGTFRPNNPAREQVPVIETLSDTVPAMSGGLDGVFPIAERVGILALFRLHYVGDNDRRSDGVVNRGVSSVVVRYGVGAHFRF